jgi:hypothetical protein
MNIPLTPNLPQAPKKIEELLTWVNRQLLPALLVMYQRLAKEINMGKFDLPVYANNAAAVAAGLTIGSLYRTGGDPDPVCVVH